MKTPKRDSRQEILEAARLLEEYMKPHKAKIEAERGTLAWKSGRTVEIDYSETDLFGGPKQKEMFDGSND